MNTILGELGKYPKYIELIKNIENKKSPIVISGLSDFGEVQIVSGIKEETKRKILLVTYNEIEAKKIIENLKYFNKNVIYFPKKEMVAYDFITESKDLPYERIDALNKMMDSKNLVVVTTIEALMQELPAKEELYKNTLEFKVGEIYSLEEIKRKLIALGYVRCDLIDARGEFSVRGGILDISLTEEKGIRIEFWGDAIDSIRHFEIIDQRSISKEESIKIYPAHEYVLEQEIPDVIERIRKEHQLSPHQDNIESDISIIKHGNYISKVDKYFSAFYTKTSTLLEYLDSKYLVCMDDETKTITRSQNIKQDAKNIIEAVVEKGRMIPSVYTRILSYDEIKNKIEKMQLVYLEKKDNLANESSSKYSFNYRDINYYKSNTTTLFDDLRKYLNENKSVYVVLDTIEKATKFKKILDDEEIICSIDEKLDSLILVKTAQKQVKITVGKINTGYEMHDIDQIVINASELIDAEKKEKKAHNSEFNEAKKVVFADLSLGDYIVHKTYGVGVYIGVNTVNLDNTVKDYIKLKYDGDDVLYVPTNQMDAIRKYNGADTFNLKLNKLGAKDWQNTKQKVKKNLRAVAEELIKLYAQREKNKGYAFSKDEPWQQEFENTFPYQETQDQLRCIEEVKQDMEKEKAMDRLLCGDVGYGKTEVALRAAFKAVMDKKQVAYLAPTTILAEQQYKEFKKRMEAFGVKVEVLNRFRSVKKQKEVIKNLKLGDVDVVIGTHRILSKDIEFKDLGLLVIDEEHRFGVKAKEQIKQYKSKIDVLTMTATPIPRTLHMSIVGIRDMSVIYEPPKVRKPVQTYVLEHDTEMVKEAILKELERGGQVLYLYNKVDSIESKAIEIEELVSEANVVYAHGRMSGAEIEDVMQKFIENKANVLVATTIMESGIDIPNANTIVVENADRLGLAQLYQIRGRVGRSDRQAYAYITYKPDKLLSEIADKRLKAIKEFAEFGSGFKIAMRDLEIRGAGSLLGEIQSGHIEQVGYDTYCTLLDEVVREINGEVIKEEVDIQIDLDVTSYIPETYLPDANQKIEVYQNIALCKNEEDIRKISEEVTDRFGPIPKELENLLSIAKIKYLAKEKNIIKIISRKFKDRLTQVSFIYEGETIEVDIEKVMKKYKNKFECSSKGKPTISIQVEKNGQHKILETALEFLQI